MMKFLQSPLTEMMEQSETARPLKNPDTYGKIIISKYIYIGTIFARP